MKTGVIDMGTNTFHLLIADDKGNVLHKEKVAVRLGQGGISDGTLSSEAIDRALITLQDFSKKLQLHQTEKTYATATSAVRSANNQNEFIQLVKEKTGIEITVLDGKDEAFLIHKGVCEYIDFEDSTGLIVDIGGGSIEFIIADRKEIKWLRSYEIGGQRLIDQFHKSDPISSEEVDTLNIFLTETLNEVYTKCQSFNASFLIGSSGSFDTFWDIFKSDQSIADEQKPKLLRKNFEKIHFDLKNKSRQQRLLIPGMIPMRVDMIVGASIVTKNIIDNCGFDLIKISPFALKEGVLAFGLPKRK
ncbi:MAG: exopolyphosphatase [Reichenbachiella sp.]